ncbi:hypothetical protein IPZ60_08740 [Psychrobacter sp. NG25]|uniref:hypothetical protein n=1 Tax=Psychrobacter sp. NG25 TaxID=2782005 RepID=UPI00188404D0|nr:hypothetical protein [Psychrobacter sp. NG25]MBF0658820.1 hypothetical protein [Psychrobacter sp. NG25]
MFISVIKAISRKQPIYAALSAAVLLTTISPALADIDTAQITDKHSITDCRNDAKDQEPSYRYQSNEQRVLNCMVDQLKPYQQADKTTQQQYLAYKAQAWLNYAINQDSMNSKSSAGSMATEMAESILQALETDTIQNIALHQDIPSNSALMRPDLWATLNALKDSDGIISAPREIAFSEVALIWAATNQCERGWRESSMHFRMADRWLEQAREAYVNAHDSQANVNLEQLIVRYYKQYAPLDTGNDVCQGQVLTPIS